MGIRDSYLTPTELQDNMVFETEEELSQYGQGTVNTLKALLSETRGTKTQGDILLAAFDSRDIPDELVHLARDDLDGQGDRDLDVYQTTESFLGACEGGRLVLVEKGDFGPVVCPFCEEANCLEKVER